MITTLFILVLIVAGVDIWALLNVSHERNLLEEQLSYAEKENDKLSNLVLEYQKEDLLLLEEHQETSKEIARFQEGQRGVIENPDKNIFNKIDTIEQQCKHDISMNSVPPETNIDKLIDKIEKEMVVTGCSSKFHSDEEFNKIFEGLCPIVTLELNGGIVKLIDCARGRPWKTDLLYNDTLFTNLTDEQLERLKKIFTEKMAEAALKDIDKGFGPEHPGCKQISSDIYVLEDNKDKDLILDYKGRDIILEKWKRDLARKSEKGYRYKLDKEEI